MKNKKILLALLAIALVLGMTACSNDSSDSTKTIANELVGKWEFEKLIIDGTETALPWEDEESGITINSGGYEFTSNGFTSYMNGEVAFSAGAYTQNNTVYASTGEAGYTYSINGNKLTASLIQAEDELQGVIANKVTKFSWE